MSWRSSSRSWRAKLARMTVSGVSVGTDLVHIPSFAQQLDTPGTSFERVFSAFELRVAQARGYTGAARAQHLAGRWAAKEAFIKAWSQARYGGAPLMAEEAVDWAEIEVYPDAWGRVALALRGEIARQAHDSLGEYTTALSISHDGDYATATVILSRQSQ